MSESVYFSVADILPFWRYAVVPESQHPPSVPVDRTSNRRDEPFLTMTLYRYEDVLFASMVDEWDNPIGSGRLEILERTFTVLKETPKGFWIDCYCTRRWVSKSSRRRYACVSKDDAWKSFQARKLRQAGIYAARLARAKQALAMPRPK